MKISKKLCLIFTGLSPFFFCGCLATQNDVNVLKTQVAVLNQTLQDMQRTQADTEQQMEDLTTQLVQSGDNLSNFDYKLDNLSTKLDNISTMLSGSKYEYKMLPSDIYAEAKTQFDAKKYAAAINGFTLYIKNAPQGQNIEETYLYLAESYFNLKDYQNAAINAALLLDKFPKSKHIAQARVLYAKSILPLDKKDEAKSYLKSVQQDFKGTPQASEAASLLKGIK
ncbi:MAG: outer membrane protein assembly factor BamD [Elusimicrobiota bacterium]|jgi:TolA-binding protein|nr:outer membrane protein assembly factor BamD [Elusimicrobiota bacterium]